MIKNLSILCFSLFMIFVVLSLSSASAQTLVAGKIYNADYSDIIADVDVIVTCTSATNSSTLSTISLNDGTYAVRFGQTECTFGDIVKVSATKGSLSGENSGNVVACEGDEPCAEPDYVAILNLNIKSSQNTNTNSDSSGSSGSRRYYLCGNGRCDSGENVKTCPKDCKTIETVQTSETVETTETNPGIETINLGDGEETEEEKDGFSGIITGAIIGILGTAGTIFTIAFIIIIIALAITIRVVRKRRTLKTLT